MGKIELAKFLRQALIIDTLRGEDSTGMFFVPHTTREGEVADWVKKVGDGYSFVEDELYAERMRKLADYKYLVGHNRAATQGAVNVENAHPTCTTTGVLGTRSMVPTTVAPRREEVHQKSRNPEYSSGVGQEEYPKSTRTAWTPLASR